MVGNIATVIREMENDLEHAKRDGRDYVRVSEYTAERWLALLREAMKEEK
jgi:hypothetical protein